ncbi:MAG: hypothetical protein CMC15_13855 [Flavobacteriaceae bacterium]|nr:hypothetical protein [Flavobacteriaceae bacterium]
MTSKARNNKMGGSPVGKQRTKNRPINCQNATEKCLDKMLVVLQTAKGKPYMFFDKPPIPLI